MNKIPLRQRTIVGLWWVAAASLVAIAGVSSCSGGRGTNGMAGHTGGSGGKPGTGGAGSGGATSTGGSGALSAGTGGATSAAGGQAGTSTGAAGAASGGGGMASGNGGQAGASTGTGGIGLGGLGGLQATSGGTGPVEFLKLRLNPDFYSEGINTGDINRDGKLDIVAGPYWYEGPAFTSKVAFRQPRPTPFDIGGDSDCYLIFVYDFNQDGWPDILSFRTAGGAEVVWYQNPKGAVTNWTEHVVFSASHDESPTFTDIDGDGKPELVTISNGFGGWAKPDWASPQAPWTFVPVTAKNAWGQYTHGLGVGDVDGDGRRDLMLSEGWWAQPAAAATPWASHPAMFWGQDDPSESYGGAQMFIDDVDGDGDRDVVTSLQAHGWGLAWFENQAGTFVKHMIVNTRAQEAQYGVAFAQPHAVDVADVDGDGLMDIVTGKRKGAHGNGLSATELAAPAVLYWFKLVRQAGQSPHYEPHLIDSEAGVGTQVTVADVNADGLADILTSGRAGAFVFLRR